MPYNVCRVLFMIYLIMALNDSTLCYIAVLLVKKLLIYFCSSLWVFFILLYFFYLIFDSYLLLCTVFTFMHAMYQYLSIFS